MYIIMCLLCLLCFDLFAVCCIVFRFLVFVLCGCAMVYHLAYVWMLWCYCWSWSVWCFLFSHHLSCVVCSFDGCSVCPCDWITCNSPLSACQTLPGSCSVVNGYGFCSYTSVAAGSNCSIDGVAAGVCDLSGNCIAACMYICDGAMHDACLLCFFDVFVYYNTEICAGRLCCLCFLIIFVAMAVHSLYLIFAATILSCCYSFSVCFSIFLIFVPFICWLNSVQRCCLFVFLLLCLSASRYIYIYL